MVKDIEEYKKRWDIIITGDGSYIVVSEIIRFICGEIYEIDKEIEKIW
jgi:hypothetical protein